MRFGFNISAGEMVKLGGGKGDLVAQGDWWRLVTQHFLHFSVEHYAFNMFVLGFTGWKLERSLGHGGMLALFSLGMAGSTLVSHLVDPGWIVSAGESGLGFAVIGGCLAADPHAREAIGKVGRYTSIMGLVSSLSPGVSFTAHFGGFVGGFIATWAILWLYRRRDPAAYQRPEPVVVHAGAAAMLPGMSAGPVLTDPLGVPPILAHSVPVIAPNAPPVPIPHVVQAVAPPPLPPPVAPPQAGLVDMSSIPAVHPFPQPPAGPPPPA